MGCDNEGFNRPQRTWTELMKWFAITGFEQNSGLQCPMFILQLDYAYGD